MFSTCWIRERSSWFQTATLIITHQISSDEHLGESTSRKIHQVADTDQGATWSFSSSSFLIRLLCCSKRFDDPRIVLSELTWKKGNGSVMSSVMFTIVVFMFLLLFVFDKCSNKVSHCHSHKRSTWFAFSFILWFLKSESPKM